MNSFHRVGASILLVGLSALARPACAQSKGRAVSSSKSLSLRVVDIAEDRAYIEPGSEQGLRLGDEVTLGGKPYKVVAISSSFAAVALGGNRMPVGTRGSLTVLANRSDTVVLTLPKPTALAKFRGEWRPASVPAAAQAPKPVPLGTKQHSRNRLTISDALYGVAPTNSRGKFVGNELRGRLHYESYSETPLAFDLDLALRTFTGDDFAQRPGAGARQLLRVRALTLTYGATEGFRGSLGRLRAASTLVGQLDGIRLEAPLAQGLRLSAYGGTVPHAFTGMISDQVARFGAELAYQDSRASLRPRLLLGAYASRFDGDLDEKKAYAAFDLLPSKARLGGHAEFSFFDSKNPWHAHGAELTSAGFDGNFELGVFHLGGRFDMRRPDRSRWLASLLPLEWLCWSNPGTTSNACLGDNASYLWLLDTGARVGKFSVDIGGQSSFTRGTDASNFGGFANLRWLDLLGSMHVDAGMSAFTGSVVRSTAITFAPGMVFAGGNADLSLSYRPALVRYRAALHSSIEHTVGMALWFAPHESLAFNMQGDWLKATDVSAVIVQGVATWHLWL